MVDSVFFFSSKSVEIVLSHPRIRHIPRISVEGSQHISHSWPAGSPKLPKAYQTHNHKRKKSHRNPEAGKVETGQLHIRLCLDLEMKK